MQRSILRLFKLAKMGQKDEFNEALKTSNVLNKLQYLSGKEASMLIYSFKRLRLMDYDLQSKFEQLYLDSNYKMNIHDHVMCAWSLKNTQNQYVKSAFIDSVKENWFQVKEMQQSKANIGLIAYLAAQENNSSDPIWNQIEQIFEQTMEHQDERNFMTVLYSYSKIQSQSKSIWILLEKYIWGKGFNQFSNRNKVLMVYSLAKANKGSIQFWESAAKCLQQVHFKYPDDIQFCIWSFAKIKFYDFEFWNSMIDKQLFIWDRVSLSDIENTTWALESLQLNDIENLWKKILVKEISQHNSDSQKYNDFDELLTIGKRLSDLKMDDSDLFRSAQELVKSMLSQPNCDLISIKRLYYLTYYLKRESPEFCLDVVKQLIQILQNSNGTSNLNFFNNVIMVAQDLQLKDQSIYDQLSQLFQNINPTFIKDNNQQNSEFIAYFWAGSNLLQHSEDQIIPKLISDSVFERVQNNVVHLCNMIKILSQYNNTQQFFYKFKNYSHPKPDIFINLFLNMLHKYKYLIPSESYKQVIGMLKSAYQSNNRDRYQNKVVDLIIQKSDNLIEELNKLFEVEMMQDLIKKYDGTIEIEQLKEQQEQFSKQRLYFYQQIDLNNQQFIDITNRKLKNRFDNEYQ